MNLIIVNAKAADPGKFQDKTDWPDWEKEFKHYSKVILDMDSLPLQYVLCENKDLNNINDHALFEERMNALAP